MNLKENNTEETSVRIGCANFKKGLTRQFIEQLMDNQIKYILGSSVWRIRNLEKVVSLIIQLAQQCSCQIIQLRNAFQCSIPKCFLIPQFTDLKELDLRYNQFTSIESLAYLKCGNLSTIDLEENLISNITALAKIKWEQLKTFRICCNRLSDFNITRAKTAISNQNNFFLLQTELLSRFGKDRSLATLAKIQANGPSPYVYACIGIQQTNNEILQPKVKNCITKRFMKKILA